MSGAFALSLQEFARKAGERGNEVVHRSMIRLATEIDDRSPVGDAKFWKSPPPAGYIGGRFRMNWQLGIGSVPVGEIDGVDTNGTIALPRIIAAIPEEAAGHVYYLANNLPYARRLEDGWSRQAPPGGIVALTVMDFKQAVDETVAEMP